MQYGTASVAGLYLTFFTSVWDMASTWVGGYCVVLDLIHDDCRDEKRLYWSGTSRSSTTSIVGEVSQSVFNVICCLVNPYRAYIQRVRRRSRSIQLIERIKKNTINAQSYAREGFVFQSLAIYIRYSRYGTFFLNQQTEELQLCTWVP